MDAHQITGVYHIEERVRKVEINSKRVAEWVLIFTNVFFVSYFLGRLFRIF